MWGSPPEWQLAPRSWRCLPTARSAPIGQWPRQRLFSTPPRRSTSRQTRSCYPPIRSSRLAMLWSIRPVAARLSPVSTMAARITRSSTLSGGSGWPERRPTLWRQRRCRFSSVLDFLRSPGRAARGGCRSSALRPTSPTRSISTQPRGLMDQRSSTGKRSHTRVSQDGFWGATTPRGNSWPRWPMAATGSGCWSVTRDRAPQASSFSTLAIQRTRRLTSTTPPTLSRPMASGCG